MERLSLAQRSLARLSRSRRRERAKGTQQESASVMDLSSLLCSSHRSLVLQRYVVRHVGRVGAHPSEEPGLARAQEGQANEIEPREL